MPLNSLVVIFGRRSVYPDVYTCVDVPAHATITLGAVLALLALRLIVLSNLAHVTRTIIIGCVSPMCCLE